MRDDARALPKRWAAEAEQLLDECIQVIVGLKPANLPPKGARVEIPTDPFLEQEERLRAFLSRYLDSDVDIQPRDVVLRLCFYWGEFTASLQFVQDGAREEFFTTFQPHPSGGTIKITCCDASKMLEPCYDEYDQVVGFSATLKPFDYYAKLSGLDPAELKTAEFTSPFPKQHRKLLIIPQISTKYSERERNYPRIAEAIQRIAEVRPGNYFAFFPSFEFMERALGQFTPPPGFTVLRQERDMRAAQIEEIIDHLKSAAYPTIVFAVQGGVFSEGVDYPGETVIGAFVVGPPLPSFDLEREQMREYYQKNYQAGFDYAYTFPAMAKAIQAAGRVIRSETDRGLIVLMDNRFIQSTYTRSMPSDWFVRGAQELVSTRILGEVRSFWDGAETPPG
jgi:DNA excision repair protein ERCC-2